MKLVTYLSVLSNIFLIKEVALSTSNRFKSEFAYIFIVNLINGERKQFLLKQ